mmetsp:Transcript_17598/g.61909  ORF Transcript_17598/g.61909 Transcript_17598/m.61909 type:complete len:240 (-) Transcript_17598:1182-1901(-)
MCEVPVASSGSASMTAAGMLSSTPRSVTSADSRWRARRDVSIQLRQYQLKTTTPIVTAMCRPHMLHAAACEPVGHARRKVCVSCSLKSHKPIGTARFAHTSAKTALLWCSFSHDARFRACPLGGRSAPNSACSSPAMTARTPKVWCTPTVTPPAFTTATATPTTNRQTPASCSERCSLNQVPILRVGRLAERPLTLAGSPSTSLSRVPSSRRATVEGNDATADVSDDEPPEDARSRPPL